HRRARGAAGREAEEGRLLDVVAQEGLGLAPDLLLRQYRPAAQLLDRGGVAGRAAPQPHLAVVGHVLGGVAQQPSQALGHVAPPPLRVPRLPGVRLGHELLGLRAVAPRGEVASVDGAGELPEPSRGAPVYGHQQRLQVHGASPPRVATRASRPRQRGSARDQSSDSALARAARESRSERSGSASSRATASATPAGSRGLTSRPSTPSATREEAPPQATLTTHRPAAIASARPIGASAAAP